MFHQLIIFIRSVMLFIKISLGCLNNPYVTYRELSMKTEANRSAMFVWLLMVVYFIFASLIRNGWENPYLLTWQLNKLIMAAIIGSGGIVLLIYILGRRLGGKGEVSALYRLWSFTLLPTIIWFILTSLFYLMLPPPRTFSIWGKLFSLVFITLSISLLYWKIILYYLTLRFGLKLDLFKIGKITSVIVPLVVIYSLITYNLGIFRIPFI